ncbi:MAG TPA: condensation domain-containing protein, partial [Pseudomonadales bacterium]|nr:condensation domain-containing protein [Pseudomonadales bacterium]
MPSRQQSPATLIEMVQDKAARLGPSTLYTFLTDDQATSYTLSYAELDRQARCIAAQLQSMNACGERALLLFPSNLDFICGFFGALYAGVVAVPAYPPRKNQNVDRLRAIIRDCQAKYVLASSQVLRIAQPMLQDFQEFAGVTFIATDQLPVDMAQDWLLPDRIDASSLAFLQYTSGSTGDPKGVMLTHGNLLYNLEMARVGIANNVNGSYVSWLPLFHDMGLSAAIQVLYRGSSGCLMAPATFIQHPQRWLWAMSDFKASVSGGPNFAYDLCIKTFSPELYEGLDLSHWRVAFNGAEPVKASTLEKFSTLFAPYGFSPDAFQPCYGLAEATVGVTGGERGGLIKKHISLSALQNHQVTEISLDSDDCKTVVACGHTWLEDELLIVHPDTRLPVTAQQVGEIWLNSPSVGLGYWHREALSEGVFHARLANADPQTAKRYLRTGDLGFMAEGQLYITGRIKELLIIRGRNYYPTDIEHCVMACDVALSPQAIAAFTVEHDNADHLVLVCEIERKHLRNFDADQLRQKICQAVAEQFELRVESVVFIKPSHMPKTSSGKIQRGLCCQRFLEGGFDALALWASAVLSAKLPQQEAAAQPKNETKTDSRQAPVTLSGDDEQEKIKAWLIHWFASQLEIPESDIDPARNLASLGVDSLLVMRTSGELSHLLGCELPADLLWEHPSINQLSVVLIDQKTLTLAPIEPWLAANSPGEILFPASSAQRRYWLMHQFAHFKTAYNLTAAYRIHGDLNIDALQGAVTRVLHRHSALRTVFFLQNDIVWQRILPPSNRDVLVFNDLSCFENDESERQLAVQLAAESAHVFDLQHGALFRCHLWKLRNNEHVLHLNIHHSVADGWSVERLLGELSHIYAALVSGDESNLSTAMPLQFVDYLRWQENNQAPDKVQKQLDYWTQKLAAAPVLELRTDFPRPALPTGEGAQLRFDVPAKLERGLRELCAREEATLYHVLLAALSLLLARYSRQDVICIGSPAANRPHRALAEVAGVFVNTVVMRNNLAGNPSFTDLLQRVKKTAQEAYNHQDFPFDQLVNALALGGDMRYSPLFQV